MDGGGWHCIDGYGCIEYAPHSLYKIRMFHYSALNIALSKTCRVAIIHAALLGVAVAQAAEVAAVAAPVTPLSNAVTQAAVQQGVFSCAGRINQVSSFLGYTPQTGALLMSPPAQPDQRLVPLAMEVATASGPAYVSVIFAPNQANGCGAAYDAVAYWSQRCEIVAAQQFVGLKKLGLLKKGITVLDGGAATKVFLMPAGSGCVSIKKEVVL